ncbi:MAG: GGDEF domain-containing protein [Caldimicrobium sp.]|nr:GGDEF domain-containing protein [Caldimicrobium sp.]MCX7874175.1 GGDEF domain-containing protein [Caldimicrobium sp.]MDW8094318.1 GGDEF domain-containing protein [Caldimicrobium sp.]
MAINDLIERIKRELEEEIKIFLYEPDILIGELLKEIIQGLKISVTLYPSHKNLLNELVKEPYQIFIMAIESGEDSELELIKEIKKIKKDLLIYGMVEYHKNIDISAIFQVGVDEIIFKPFSMEEFKARLWRLLREYYLTKKIERYLVEDALTLVFNRRYFETTLRDEAYRALRQNYPLTLIMIDLDNFKYYNDTYGHKAGDELLMAVGKILLKNTRQKIDKPCRYGGDEFAIILPYTDWEKALKVVERIITDWELMGFHPVTLSIGISQLIDRGDLEKSISDLINRADQSLYIAKKRKGNIYEVDGESLKLISDEVSLKRDLPYQASL